MLKLPSFSHVSTIFESSLNTVSWVTLTKKVKKAQEDAGKGDAFQEAKTAIERMSGRADFSGLRTLLKKRSAARALSQIWVEGGSLGDALFNVKLLMFLIEAQAPRLGRIVLINLVTIYFKKFDLLNNPSSAATKNFLGYYAGLLKDQLALLPEKDSEMDVLQTLKKNKDWLISPNAPSEVVSRTRANNQDLDDYLEQLGIRDIADGRFSDICRSSYYLETLKEIPVGAEDPVLHELQKSSVYSAPYEEGKTIGIAALEIMIDRATEAPGDSWEKMIFSIAGDPRISDRAKSYREWWTPLGSNRVQKVRSWLAKADLKLFLRAVEEYGFVSGNHELQRMFPDRKVFLEGLLSQGVIRNTRLMLGDTAKRILRNILDEDLNTSYVRLTDSQMSDKSVIYVDCGDFHIIEGSHDFKIWIYLNKPSELVTDYSTNDFTWHILTKTIPKSYWKTFNKSPVDIIHNKQWQSKVIKHLADNGVDLDIEQLFTKSGYREYLNKHGIPVVKPRVPR
ncbi:MULTISPECIES: EH signature domain-containing protein [unclassified Marinobacterium]|uniref:EH signature domain-containing protein n=1 Tax=unclassified Marinobacterium TaxID=2644139 RepID=UPI001567C6BD|nr:MULTISPECIES: EH signature domain-containing protein [unclassified Marinobacterium]NRP10082.1 hypothetical protein [Marinobacterium sp. xm-g-48]NRP82927.1 hypothetical protein [Marinobacterium sp. xm-d-509]